MESLEEWLDKRRVEFVLKQNPKNIMFKSEYYALNKEEYFGNRAKTWDNYEDFLRSKYNGLVCIRSKVGIDRKQVRYNLPASEVLDNIKQMGLEPSQASINESMPDNNLTIQGEVIQLDGRTGQFGIELRYSTLKKTMNVALNEEDFYLRGLNAKLKLKGAMDVPSYENLLRLFDEFPNSAIEFSCYDIGVGHLGHNTIFWEVRNY